jgi:hypothetical protein
VIKTPDLIDSLVAGLKPVPRRAMARRLGLGVGFGAAIALAITLSLWGVRPDLANALATSPFWMKFAFAAALCFCGLAAIRALARPEGRVPTAAWFGICAILLTMMLLAGAQLLAADVVGYRRLVLGATAAVCPWLIALLSLPILIGVLSVMRTMAPTQLPLAGAAAGLVAGSAAACVYAISCDESSAVFVLLFYGLGIAVPTAVGGLIGSRVLRW